MGILGTLGLDAILGEVGKTVRQILPNKEAQREFDLKWAEVQDRTAARIHAEMLAQIEVNKTEAGHASLFVAGWRPFIGWVCGAALLYNFLLSPMLVAFVPELKMLDIEGLIALVLTMLGSSGIRTFEKVKGVGGDTLASPRRPMPMLQVKDEGTLNITNVDTGNIDGNEVPTSEGDAPWNRN